MKIVGIIAEYNPFHEGHAYQIKKAKEISGADYCIVVMSGHFVQRGEPAIMNPYIRCEQALRHGADAVFMMPVRYSTSSAGDFALAGVSLLDSLGCDYISYGVEPEKNMANAGGNQKDDFFNGSDKGFLKPNNILAAEYINAIRSIGSDMIPIEVERVGHDYNDSDTEGEYPSATAIRKAMLTGCNRRLQSEYCKRMFPNIGLVSADDLVPIIEATVKRLINDGVKLDSFVDVNRELSDRIRNCDFTASCFEELVVSLKTKRYTYTRISRCLMHILLDIRKSEDTDIYAHLIGFRKEADGILKELKRRSDLILISKPADYRNVLKKDAYASDIYGILYKNKCGQSLSDFYRQQRVIVL